MKKSLQRLREYGHICRIINNYENAKKRGLQAEDVDMYNNLVSQAKNEKIWAENFVNSIDDLFIREIILQRYFKGKTWKAVAVAMGSYATEDCYRKAVSRYIHA